MSKKAVNEFLDELKEEIKLAPKLYYQFEQLQAENKNKTEALQRHISGEAFFVGGHIPEESKSEWATRRRFTELVLEGKTVKMAIKRAVDEQQKIMDNRLAEINSKEYHKDQKGGE